MPYFCVIENSRNRNCRDVITKLTLVSVCDTFKSCVLWTKLQPHISSMERKDSGEFCAELCLPSNFVASSSCNGLLRQ
jgi:hypothetical protein